MQIKKRKEVKKEEENNIVHLRKEKQLPKDYVGESKYAKKYCGQLIKPDGSFYSRLERRKNYDVKLELKHPAKTPLHIARWAIQEFTKEGDWVFDPTMGAGTTAVESLVLNRNVAGIELEFIDVVLSNVKKNENPNVKCKMFQGDAVNTNDILSKDKQTKNIKFDLIVNNPPYSGDESQKGYGKDSIRSNWYDRKYHNLALYRENESYINFMDKIYKQCVDRLNKGGYFVVGVKDMMRNKQPFKLHEILGDILSQYLSFEKMVLLKHYPTTLFINTYEKKTGVVPPLYQTILVFKK